MPDYRSLANNGTQLFILAQVFISGKTAESYLTVISENASPPLTLIPTAIFHIAAQLILAHGGHAGDRMALVRRTDSSSNNAKFSTPVTRWINLSSFLHGTRRSGVINRLSTAGHLQQLFNKVQVMLKCRRRLTLQRGTDGD